MNDMKNTIEAVLVENERRKALLVRDRYDPLAGVGCCGDRVESGGCFIPRVVLQANPDFAELDPLEQERMRIEEDFEFWCARCVTIKDKMSGRNVPFILNRPQRRLLGVMEDQRTAGKPVRVILLKARQWVARHWCRCIWHGCNSCATRAGTALSVAIYTLPARASSGCIT